MIEMVLYQNSEGSVHRFRIQNHGDPIVCAGVSALAITCANFLSAKFSENIRQSYDGSEYIDVEIIGDITHDMSLIIQNMVFGIDLISDAYPNQIKIIKKRCLL